MAGGEAEGGEAGAGGEAEGVGAAAAALASAPAPGVAGDGANALVALPSPATGPPGGVESWAVDGKDGPGGRFAVASALVVSAGDVGRLPLDKAGAGGVAEDMPPADGEGAAWGAMADNGGGA